MKKKFSDLPWHDAVLLDVSIDRRNPGECDQVIINLCWPNREHAKIVFHDCYGLEAKMNFGVVASESILDASLINESPELTAIRERWGPLGLELENLRCFEIKTNSTASLLRIYALNFSV